MSNPNFLLITLDTVRWDAFGCYGQDSATPAIDQLAESGVLFEQAITNGTYTKTAFPPILSSTFASQYGGPFHDSFDRRPMIARILREAGYQTAAITANPLLGAHLGYDSGFDTYEEPVPAPDGRWWLRIKGAQRLLRKQLLNELLMRAGLDTLPHPVYVAGSEISNWAIKWLRSSTQPFFLWLHYMDAHWPYHHMESLNDSRSRADAWKDLHTMSRSWAQSPGDEVLSRIRGLYAASIEQLDAEVARVLGTLRDTGFDANTVVVLTSDHGEAFHEHGRWQHGAVLDFHEEVLRVPLIMHGPGIDQGSRAPDLVGLIDLPPTLLGLAGLPIPATMAGQSLMPVVKGDGRGPSVVISEMLDLDWYCVALRSEKFKFIYDEREPWKRQVYDLKEDPDEQQNLAGTMPQVELELEFLLQRHLDQVRLQGARDKSGGWNVETETVKRLRTLGYID